VRFLLHSGGVNLLAQLVNFAFFAAAKFFLNGLHFFVEVILFLRAFHLAFDARINVALNVQFFQLDVQNFFQLLQALDGIEHLEQFLFFFKGKLTFAAIASATRPGSSERAAPTTVS